MVRGRLSLLHYRYNITVIIWHNEHYSANTKGVQRLREGSNGIISLDVLSFFTFRTSEIYAVPSSCQKAYVYFGTMVPSKIFLARN